MIFPGVVQSREQGGYDRRDSRKGQPEGTTRRDNSDRDFLVSWEMRSGIYARMRSAKQEAFILWRVAGHITSLVRPSEGRQITWKITWQISFAALFCLRGWIILNLRNILFTCLGCASCSVISLSVSLFFSKTGLNQRTHLRHSVTKLEPLTNFQGEKLWKKWVDVRGCQGRTILCHFVPSCSKDENQVYPEYIIWYRRVYNIEWW